MNRFVLSGLIILLFLAATKVKPQDGTRKTAEINILNAESMEAPYQGMASDAIRLIGNVRLRHEDVLMECDSAHRYSNSNIVHAFGNVHINQGDTVHLSGDYITYYGNRRYAEVRQNVRLTDKETTLTTEYLDFDLQNDFGYYPAGAVVINGDNRLESIKGYYYTKQKLFYFQDSVIVTNPDYVIESDTLKYNTVTEVAYFLGPTYIRGDEINIYCENGWYNTQTDIAQFNENARVTNNNQVLSADSLYYDNRKGTGEAFINIEVVDTTENIVIKGDYAWFVREPEQLFVTDKALFIQMSGSDTLYLHADTLRSWIQIGGPDPVIPDSATRDTLSAADAATSAAADTLLAVDTGEIAPQPADTISLQATTPPADTLLAVDTGEIAPQPADTISLQALPPPSDTVTVPPPLMPLKENDTVRIITAYYGVRFFSNDMQGKCDSLYYNMRDSVIHMFNGPVIWSDESQLSANYIEMHSRNGNVDHIVMNNSAFIVSEETTGLYNQIKGNNILGYFRDSELYRVNVSGNAETLYYPAEDEEIIGINKAASANLIIFLRENKPDRIRFLTSPDATLYPVDELSPAERLLENFQWLDDIRPKSREDVFMRINQVNHANNQ